MGEVDCPMCQMWISEGQPDSTPRDGERTDPVAFPLTQIERSRRSQRTIWALLVRLLRHISSLIGFYAFIKRFIATLSKFEMSLSKKKWYSRRQIQNKEETTELFLFPS